MWGLMACTSTESASPPRAVAEKKDPELMSTIHGQPQPEVWFAGPVTAAFMQAKKDNKLVFLYWGAVWCPPCNELKANVFSQKGFADLMQAFVPVYLDGDTEEAQIWGEKLQIAGYPTVLVLDAEQGEMFRLNSSVDLAEFTEAVQPLVGKSQNFAHAAQRVEQGKPTPADWKVLAYADWDQLPQKQVWTASHKLKVLGQALALIPSTLTREKALLSAQWLSFAAQAPVEGNRPPAPPVAGVKKIAQRALDAVLNDPVGIRATRVFINNQAEAVSRWLYPQAKGPDFASLKARWEKAASLVEADPTVSIDNRLWAVYPALVFNRLEHPGTPVPEALKQRVQKAVARANEQAKEPFSRHAVISGAAYLLRQVGDAPGARQLLTAEAEKTDTPWYYYSSLAGLEQEMKQPAEARKWAEKARQTAQGRASKIQWITSDIALNAKLQSPEQKAYLLTVTKEFYDLATQLSDGFAGRNRTRADTVRDSLTSFRRDHDFAQLFVQYEKRCQQLQGENKSNCQQHFKGLL